MRSSRKTGNCRWILGMLVVLAPGMGWAQLALDPGFGNGGKVTTSITSFTSEGAAALAIDSQNRVVVAYAGYDALGISRHNADGSLDTSFGDNGVSRLGFTPSDLVLQADGKIVAVGTNQTGDLVTEDWQVARLLPDGSLDSSFASSGILTVDWYGSSDEAKAVALDNTGNIIVGGFAYYAGVGTSLAVLSIDTTGSILHSAATKIYAGTADICQDVLVQPDDKILCVGLVRSVNAAQMVAVRFMPDLQLDTSYGTGGIATVAFGTSPAEANSALLLSNGALILGGFVNRSYDYSLAMARLTANGALDTTFGTGGRVERAIAGETAETIQDMVQFQGAVFVAASNSDIGKFALLRFATDGTADTSFGSSGLALADFHGKHDSSQCLAVHQGALLVGGSVRALASREGDNIGLARFLPGGALDNSFSADGKSEVSLRGPVNAEALGAAQQADGKIVAVGYVGLSFTDRDFAVARFNGDGSLDNTFGQQGIVTTDFAGGEDDAMAVAAQADGRLLVAGQVREPVTGGDIGIARYTAAGALDTGFGVGGLLSIDVDGGGDVARAIKLQSDGRILLAGDSIYPSLGYSQNMTVVRLMADGSRDTTFGDNGVAYASVGDYDEGHALAVQSNGKILVGGIGNGDFAIARFQSDGTLDSTFGSAGVATYDFAAQFDFLQDLLILPDWNGQGERILAVGSARTGSSASSGEFAAALFDLNGNPEPGFGSGGAVMVDLAPGQAEGATAAAAVGNTLVLAGSSTLGAQTDFALLGLTPTGSVDTSFTRDGSASFVDFFASSDQANAITIGASGEVVLVGSAFDPSQISGRKFALARFADGDLIFRSGFENQ